MHWAPTASGYTLDGFDGRAELTRTPSASGRASWTLHTDHGSHDLGRKASFDRAEALLFPSEVRS